MDKQGEKKRKEYSYLQNIFNCWTLPLLLRWNQKELEVEDIPEIYTASEAEKLGNELSLIWDSESKRCGNQGGLWKVLGRKFGRSFLIVLILLLFQQCGLRLSLPIFLGLLVRFLDGNFSWKFGYILAAGFVLTVFLSSLIFHPCIFECQKIGMQVRIGLTNLIYKKVLRLNQKSLSESGIGKLTNILSNDVNRFDDVMEFIPFVIIGPLQLTVVTCMLWNYLGASCIPGLGLLLLLMPIQGFLGKEFGRLRMKVAGITDSRVRCLTELLSGILLIKMSAWEDTYEETVQEIRKLELTTIQRKNRFAGLNHTLFLVSTKMSILVTFLTFVLTDHDLSTEKVFVTLAMYNIIALTVGQFLPLGISGLSEFIVSIKRIETILLLEEKEGSGPVGILKMEQLTPLVDLKNVSGSWGKENKTIQNISFRAQSGDLIGIIGSVGSGKSSILQAVLHELPMEDPNSVVVLGSVAYASQEPCLFPDSIRNNILLGREYESDWYSQVIQASGLTTDLALFPFGDETLVGDKGVTLSGGQKARVNLARAVYSQADIYLLDDPLSALDVRVARHVMEKCINGLLRSKCVILVTHQTHFLRERVTELISVEKGKIIRRGTYDEVLGDGGAQQADPERPSTIAINDIELGQTETDNDTGGGRNKQRIEPMKIEEDESGGKLKPKAEQELRRHGSVGWKLFWTYFKAGNSYCSLSLVMFLVLFTQILQNGSDIWLKIWADKQDRNRFPLPGDGPASFPYLPFLPHHLEYVELYGGLVALFFVFSLCRVLSIFSTLLSSGAQLHEKLFAAILRAPMSFFQINSEGLILKLFSNDVGVMDERLPTLAYNVIGTVMQVLGSMTVVSLMSPLLIIPTFLLLFVIYIIQRIYIRSSGSLKRIEGIARSPVFGQLTTTLSALPTIRAFKAQVYFYNQFLQAQDRHSSAFFLYLASFRWLTMTLELVSNLYICLVMVYLLGTGADSSSFGLALTAALCIINDGTGMVMFSAQIINQMISIERILDYTGIEPEEDPQNSKTRGEADPTWPMSGDFEFENMTVAYKDGPNILDNINLEIKDGEKVGIIGRTGAGKTTLVAALFRIIQPKNGEIRIAGVRIQNLPLKTLRVKLSIIPQNPVLLAGTLRRNLDPFSEYSDDRIWEALDVVQLKTRIGECGQGLSYQLSEGGLNFSQGERQLISLGRTILRQNKILVLDEATANIDTKTDGIIQHAIRERFKSSTVLTIAHRLETIMDSDRILVLDGGRIREFDSPSALLSNQDSFLCQLVQRSGEGNAAKLMGMIKPA